MSASALPYPHAAAARAGGIAAVAYLAAMALDKRLIRPHFDDLALLGRPFSADPRVWRPLGVVIHFANGAALGMACARVGGALPGAGWVRGLLFAQLENLALWPLMLAVDRAHPGRRDGTLPRAWSGTSFAAAAWRHAAYGASLGALLTAPRRPS